MARLATHHHQTIIDGIKIEWIDGDEGTGRAIMSVHTGTNDKAKRVDASGNVLEYLDEKPGLIVFGTHKWDCPDIYQAMEICPDHADKLYEIHFQPVNYRPYLGTVDVGYALGVTPSTVRRIIAADPPDGCFKNSSGWQITWDALNQLKNRPKPGPKRKQK